MKTRNKILSGIVLTGLLGTSVYASCNMNKNNGEMNFNKNGKSHMIKGSHQMKKNMPILRVLKQLDLTSEQKSSVKEIIMDSRKNKKYINSAFTKNSFNKAEFIKTMSEKRENMIKSKADMIEKVYAVLDVKQKEQFKVLIDLKTQKMNKRFN